MGKFICKICGAEENTERWFNGSDLEKHQMCQSCNHWREQHELDKYESNILNSKRTLLQMAQYM